MLTFTDFHGSRLVRVGKAIAGVSRINDGLLWIMDRPIFDPVPLMIDRAYVDLGYHVVEDTLGMFRDHGTSTREVLYGTKPVNTAYDGPLDQVRYSSILSNVALAGKLLRGESVIFTPANEQEVKHSAYHGDLGPRIVADGLFDEYVYSPQSRVIATPGIAVGWGPHGPDLFDLSHAPYSVRANKITFAPAGLSNVPYVEVLSGTSSELDNCLSPLITNLEYIRDHWAPFSYANSGTGGATHWYRVQVQDFTWTNLSRFPIDITYRLKMVMGHNPDTTFDTNVSEWDMLYRIDFIREYAPPLSLPTEGTFDLQSIGELRVLQRATFESGQMLSEPSFAYTLPLPGTVFERLTSFTDGFVYTSNVSEPLGSSSVHLGQFRKKNLVTGFSHWVDQDMNSIRLAAMQSTVSALDTLSDDVNTNFIESISELRDIAGLIPNLDEGFQALKALVKKDYLLTVKSTLDLLSSLQLQYSFGIDPNIRILTETIPRLHRALATISRLSSGGEVYARGSFFYEFPFGAFGREYTSLTARTKITMLVKADDVLIKMIGVRSLGLLPTASSLWDLVPMSFVLDWLWNLGSRMRDIEGLSLISLLNVQRYVHSFRVDSPFTDDELAIYGLATSLLPGSIPPLMRVFRREVSACVPPVRDGRFDFRIPGRAPPWFLPGSLLWQVLLA